MTRPSGRAPRALGRALMIWAGILSAGIVGADLGRAQAPAAWMPPPPPPAPPVGGAASEDPPAVVMPPPAPAPPAESEPVAYLGAIVQTLDKITGRVRQLVIEVDQTQRAGALAVTLRACRARPHDELPDSAAFLEVNEARGEDGTLRRLFTGWMFASTPAASALEHAVYDVWLVACNTSSRGSSR